MLKVLELIHVRFSFFFQSSGRIFNTDSQFLTLDFKKNKAFNYAVSVPYTKVRINEVILAYEMNGEPL